MDRHQYHVTVPHRDSVQIPLQHCGAQYPSVSPTKFKKVSFKFNAGTKGKRFTAFIKKNSG